MLNQLSKTNVQSFVALLLLGLLWGLTIPLSKISLSTGHPVIGVIFWQLVIGVIALGAIIWIKGYRVPLSPSHLRFYLIIALLGTLVPNFFSMLAVRELPAGIWAIVIATVPMLAFGVALMVKIEQYSFKRLGGLLLGVSAMMVIALPDTSLPDRSKTIWVLPMILASFCYALEANFVALKRPTDVNAISVLFGASVFGAMIAGPVAWISGNFLSVQSSWNAPEWALVGASLGHAAAYSGYIWLVGYAGVVFASQCGYIVTIAGIGFSVLLLHESYSLWVLLSLMLVLIGVLLVQPRSTNGQTIER